MNARFFAAAQNDFAARLKWSVTPKFAGATVRLQAETSDPDRNTVKLIWWQYNDAGTYPGEITISDPSALTTTFHVPDDAQPGQLIHVILEATDNGAPALTRYQRVIVRVQ